MKVARALLKPNHLACLSPPEKSINSTPLSMVARARLRPAASSALTHALPSARAALGAIPGTGAGSCTGEPIMPSAAQHPAPIMTRGILPRCAKLRFRDDDLRGAYLFGFLPHTCTRLRHWPAPPSSTTCWWPLWWPLWELTPEQQSALIDTFVELCTLCGIDSLRQSGSRYPPICVA